MRFNLSMKVRPCGAAARCAAWLTLCAVLAGCVTQDVQHRTETFGVLVMAHGGSAEWNQAVREVVQPLAQRHPTEVAFGMADAHSIEEGVHQLESRGVQRIAVVRLFISGESFKDRTAQILGLEPGAPPAPSLEQGHTGHGEHAEHAADHGMGIWRIPSAASFVMSEDGLLDAPQMGIVMAERAAALSRHPESEDVLLLAHGPGDDAENQRWLAKLDARAEAVRHIRSFRRVQVETLREDWPDKRAAAEERVRAFVQRAHAEHGTAIVIPFRVDGFGPYAQVLQGLDYVADGRGLLPHREVSRWLEQQADTLEAR